MNKLKSQKSNAVVINNCLVFKREFDPFKVVDSDIQDQFWKIKKKLDNKILGKLHSSCSP